MNSLSATSTQDLLQQIRNPIQDDLLAVEKLMQKELASDVPLIQTINKYIIEAGGKRLRPLVVLLCAKACGLPFETEHYELAAVIEFIHTATLLHDDVVDVSLQRRGKKTVNNLWGNSACVLVGDFLYSRAFQILALRSNVAVTKVLANTTNLIAEGEIEQLLNQNNMELSQAEYFAVIRHKTAELFSAAAQTGALLSTQNKDLIHAMKEFGLHFGMAFQIMDDLLDYCGDDQLGKNRGDDLHEGKITLPLIYLFQNLPPEKTQQIKQNLKQQNLQEILHLMQTYHAITYTLNIAKEFAQKASKALDILAPSAYKTSLQLLVDLCLARNY